MSDNWEGLVGSQTPREFMQISTKRKGKRNYPYSEKQIEQAVKSYVRDLPKIFPTEYPKGDKDRDSKVRSALIREIKNDCKKSKDGKCYL